MVNVFRKDPVRDQWEVWVEVMEGSYFGQKLKIYTDDEVASRLMRGNQYEIVLSKIFRYHSWIAPSFKHLSAKDEEV